MLKDQSTVLGMYTINFYLLHFAFSGENMKILED